MDIPTHSADLTVSILLDQIVSFWDGRFRPHLDRLEDEEYLWEPTKGSLSLRPGARHCNPRDTFPRHVPEPSNIGINPEAPVTLDGTMRHPPPKSNEDNCVAHGEHVRSFGEESREPWKVGSSRFPEFPLYLERARSCRPAGRILRSMGPGIEVAPRFRSAKADWAGARAMA